MIRSMTGFGDASEQVEGVHYAVELRSLNNRFFKATIRLPDQLANLEAELEIHLRKHLPRGSITLVVNRRSSGLSAAHQINDAALLAYLDHLENIHQRFAAQDRNLSLDLTALLALPGVLEPDDQEALVKQARPVVIRLVDKACEKLTAMRVSEGRVIAQDLARQSRIIQQRMADIAARAPQVIEEYHLRLKTRIDDLAKRAELTIDHRDLIREVAVFADRADITEECSRMQGHLKQFEDIIAAPDNEPSGRTLEFLTQEMLREANTLASKSNDSLISRAAVEVKSAIDKIKEQTQNVE